MADVHDKETRSRNMAAIHGRDTKPELIIRRGLHSRGFRYRLCLKTLPGKPDLVFPKYHAVIFVNGCFWHGHDCDLFKWPKTREEFWREKITGNVARDQKNYEKLRGEGWRIAVVWECALKGRHRRPPDAVVEDLSVWLQSEENNLEIVGLQNTP